MRLPVRRRGSIVVAAAILAGAFGAIDATPMPTAAQQPAVTPRYFGDGPWEAIRSAAVEVTKPCSVSVDDVRAMMVAPVFKEASAATSPTTSPSPMTLSRWDEWNGTFSTDDNRSANYGLYENRDPYTSYQRAFWHPGVGIWQYDSAGVGAPYLASESIDVRVIAADVARGMVNRYCASAATTNFDRRRAAWQPWGADCTTATAANNLCESEFQDMRGTTPSFSNISVVTGIAATGGMLTRSCRVDGVTYSCWYVDPGRAQGATGWTSNPTGAPGPTSAQTPLSYPFYVFERNGREERHWLTEDTGYAVDISATRLLGKNARPRSGAANVGSGLTWSRSSSLCDVTTGRGNCGSVGPPPLTTLNGPPTVSQVSVEVNGAAYEPISLDLDGNGRNDLFWYGPGAVKDAIWISTGNGTFRSGPATNVGGVYRPKVLDANGDGRDDVLWYAPSDPVKRVWLSRGDGTFTKQSYRPGTRIEPVVVDRDGKGGDEILWYGRGTDPDRWWIWSGSAFVRGDVTVNGTYFPFVGDFDGNGAEDIFWYGPGSDGDSMWMHTRTGRPLPRTVAVNGYYFPMVGDFDGDRRDDIIWYAPGSNSESLWWGSADGSSSHQNFVVNELYVPLVVDLGDDGRDDVAWYDQADGTDSLWTTWSADRSRASRSFEAPPDYLPVVGRFGNGGPGGVFWYGAGELSAVWWT